MNSAGTNSLRLLCGRIIFYMIFDGLILENFSPNPFRCAIPQET